MKNQTTFQTATNKSIKSIVFLGIIILVLGLLAIIYPEGFGKFSVITLGIFLIIGGVFRLTFAIFTFSMGNLFLRYLYGFLMTTAGVWLIANPDMGLEGLTILMAAYFIIDGATEIFYSFSLVPIGGGLFFLISGIISIIIGILIFSNWPEASNYVLGIYIGIKLFVDGLMLALTGKSVQKSLN